MKKISGLLLFLFVSFFINPDDFYKNYVQVYGEGPVGQYMQELKTVYYSKEDGINLAIKEIEEFLSGMIYGYVFEYKVENKLNNTKGYFDIKNISRLNLNNKFFKYTQIEESINSVRLQGTYRLSDNQKNYINGFNSSVAHMSMGEAKAPWMSEWDKRIEVYKEALRDAVLNEAKKRLKSRPLYIKGRIRLKESPRFFVMSGDWHARVKIDIMISDVSYNENY
jgi:hypothetical protein